MRWRPYQLVCLFLSPVKLEEPKALLDLENGMAVLVNSEAPEEWVNRIRRLSEQTLEDRCTTALQLRDQYSMRYSWEKECKRIEMILELVESTQNEFSLNICLTGILLNTVHSDLFFSFFFLSSLN